VTRHFAPPTPALLAKFRRALREKGCLLCGRRPQFMDVWVPDEAMSRRLGAPAGKIRTVGYSLCRRCLKRPGVMTRVERRILADVARELGAPTAN
jgi:hypothetical protein